MAIGEGTQPAAVTWTTVWGSGNGKTTASFTPEAGALLVALVAGSNPGAGTASISDSIDGTTGWVLLRRENTYSSQCQGTAEVWCKNSPGASMTVTATSSAATGAGGQLTVRTLTGALAAGSQNGAVNSLNNDSPAAVQCSVAAGTGNRVYCAAMNWDTSAAMSVLANTSSITAYADGTNGNNWAACTSTGDTAGTATYGYSTSVRGKIAAVEIIASGGTPANVTGVPASVPAAAPAGAAFGGGGATSGPPMFPGMVSRPRVVPWAGGRRGAAHSR